MPIPRRVYVSVPGDSNLAESQQQLKWAFISKLAALGFVPEMFYSERPQPGSLAQGGTGLSPSALLFCAAASEL